MGLVEIFITLVLLLLEGVPGEFVLLNVQHQNQLENMCVPTCASMVLDYYGELVSPERLRTLSIYDSYTFAGLYYQDLINGLNKLGYAWEIRVIPYGKKFDKTFYSALKEIEKALDNHHPVIISTTSPPIGHSVLVVGYFQSKKLFFINDPAKIGIVDQVISIKTLKRIWHEEMSAYRAWILTQPKAIRPN